MKIFKFFVKHIIEYVEVRSDHNSLTAFHISIGFAIFTFPFHRCLMWNTASLIVE